MSVSTVVTMGFGSFGSVNRIPTVGYSIGSVVITVTQPSSRSYRVSGTRSAAYDVNGTSAGPYDVTGPESASYEVPGAR